MPDAVTRKDGIVLPGKGLATVQALDSQVVMAFPMVNNGHFPVRLTEVRSPGHSRLFAQTVVRMDAGVHHTASIPFRTFGYAIQGIRFCD